MRRVDADARRARYYASSALRADESKKEKECKDSASAERKRHGHAAAFPMPFTLSRY